ncbi:hypothetical protein [Lacipirellula parvula]|uniref:Uncharacterized protein n=1 Tax=Lacipirellula parvula TaxID=2650471 RepID=A0A5K7X597_9BACT|nr:hypothetical protein [Lacipirellula parvula]BBO31565.1 hypothetical protein PLANPX_1177 [Lacipirellula parvula]
MVRTLLVTVVGLFVSATAAAEEIPLKSIWALDMPGTQDIRKLDPPREKQPESVQEFIKSSLVERTAQTLNSDKLTRNGGTGRGFVVAATGVEALKQSHDVLAKEAERVDSVPAGEELSLVFYSYSSGQYVHLEQVERDGETITVKYRNVPHRTLDMSPHIALIPLGELSAGKYRVKVEELPPKEKTDTPQKTRHVVCDSFSFVVSKTE